MKKWRNKLYLFGVLLLSIILVISSITFRKSVITSAETTTGNLVINKTATDLGNDQYKITFDVKGKAEEAKPTVADIVLILDESGSMDKYYDTSSGKSRMETCVESFAKTIFDSGANVRIALGGFSDTGRIISEAKNEEVVGHGRNQYKLPKVESNNGFISDIENFNNVFARFESQGDGTNTQSGIQEAAALLSNARPEAEKYVVFFTDGAPTLADGLNHNYENASYYEYPFLNKCFDDYVKAVQKDYDKNFGLRVGINGNKVSVGGIGYKYPPDYHYEGFWGSQLVYDYSIGKSELINRTINPSYKDAKFYSLGLITSASDDDIAKPLLFSLQNMTTDINDYKKVQDGGKYYTDNINDVSTIYNTIAADIKTQINTKIAVKSVIKEKVSEEFAIPSNISEMKLEGISSDKVSIDYNKNTIDFNVGDMGESGATISFNVSAKDDYYSKDGIEINDHNTVIEYKDPLHPNGEIKTQEFNYPVVNIKPKEASIKVIKEVSNYDESIKDETFDICLHRDGGYGDYNFQLKNYNKSTDNNEEENAAFINVYLKDLNTDISFNNDYSKNYLNVGQYSISEILPINYNTENIKVEKVTIGGDGKESREEVKANDFTIDKNNNNFVITVTNKKLNENCWYDNDEEPNELPYKAS